ncbi:MAG: methylated-DNA--[protein]-cysteine S-methyltransferase [Caldilineaceae bacterium]|nr:methylated-DNA--[protein]-cysteine S-methyltransferase [Caldilineaceae bacterium]
MTTDYERIAQAIQFLEEHYQEQPSLDELAARLALSPFHLQRLFTQWAGVSPKRFVQYLTAEHAKTLLANAHSVLDTAYATGLSGPSRLHDLLLATEAVTPGEFKTQGAGLPITYGRHATPFGDCLLAVTHRGICQLLFLSEGNREGTWTQAVTELHTQWQAATLQEDPSQTQPILDQIFPAVGQQRTRHLSLLLKGTNFQIKVWHALLQIPSGALWSYDTVARAIGQPSAARAVGSAIGANPIGYLIPCHRVIRKNGSVQGYRWGTTRKKALLAWESAQQENREQAA